jgi:nitrogen fixation/metabolism regulation signal transduction histidine kinase
MSLRTRLFLALLALALVPTLVFAWFTWGQLHTATARWYQSGVEDALEAAATTNRTTLARLEANALEHVDAWAGPWSALDADPAQRSRARVALREAGLDFAQVYERDGEGWRLAATVTPTGATPADTVDLSSEIATALTGDRLLRSPSGVLGAVAPLRDGVALVTGLWLNPAYWEQLNQVREAREHYARLGVFVEIARQRVGLTIAAMALVLLLGAVLLARVLAGGMTRPLARLSTALAGLDDARTTERLPESGPQELAALAAAFNAMTARLGEARTALARAEREAAWRDVARKLAHELKNPLTPMSLSIHRLQKRVERVPEADRAAVRESLEAMMQELDHLTRLADSFAQYARLPEPRAEALDLAALARSAAALHENDRVAVHVESHGPLPVRGDALSLSRALHNLIVNACEASPDDGTVEVVTGAQGDVAWVEVRDRGPGLSPSIAARVFEPWVSTKQRGSGLGLSLVRDIATQHHGQVTLVDRADGGAVARLTLPLA